MYNIYTHNNSSNNDKTLYYMRTDDDIKYLSHLKFMNKIYPNNIWTNYTSTKTLNNRLIIAFYYMIFCLKSSSKKIILDYFQMNE